MLGVLSAIRANAQNVDSISSIKLEEVTITNTRLHNYAIGHFIQDVDSTTSRYAVATNAAELMRKFGYGHLRSYGVGGVNTPSFRGTGASHTALLWNGINIMSPMLGQSDLSLIPVTFIDDIQFQSGGSASLYGSGAIGGTIQFNNKAVFQQGLNLSLTENIGSFNTFFHGLSASWSQKKWISSTRIFQTSAENNFPFLNNNISPAENQRRSHNAVEQHGILQQNYFQLSRNNLVSFRFWFQDNHYEVPEPTTVVRQGTATQRDQFFRSMIGWNHDYAKGHLFIQSAYVHHLLHYKNPLTGIDSQASYDTFINTVENTINAGRDIEWTSGLNYTFESTESVDLIEGGPHRDRVALYTAFKHSTGSWTNVLSARQEMVSGKLTPFSPSIGIDYRIQDHFSAFGSLSRNYRIPTFNDLFWNDASAKGNPNLKMETSWSEEVGGKIRFSQFNGQFAVFSNQVDDLIYWGQDLKLNIWTPSNIRNSWSRGIETSGTFSRDIGKIRTALTARYTYTRSTDEHGYQLVFTPKHESGITMQLTWKSWNLSIANNYTGNQYTDDTNSSYLILRSYNITNVWMSKEVMIKKKIFITAIGEINNVFDKAIAVRQGYPLPGRNFKAGFTIRFNKPIK